MNELFINPMSCPDCGERIETVNKYDFLPHGRMFEICDRCWQSLHHEALLNG